MAYCIKCGADVKEEAKFCPKCGTPIPKGKKKGDKEKSFQKEKKDVKKKLTSPTLSLVFKILIIISVIGVLFFFAIPVPYTATEVYTVNEPYDAEEKYTVKEPYAGTETYYEDVSYSEEECEYIRASYNSEAKQGDMVGEKHKIICTITNFESEPIEFQYSIYLTEGIGDGCGDYEIDSYDRVVTIGSGQTIEKEAILDPRGFDKWCLGCWAFPQEQVKECDIVTKFKSVPKQTEVTRYRDVEKTRTVTKYRDVEKTRTVTKYRDVEKTRKVTKYATSYQQWAGQVDYYYKVE